MTIIKSDSSHDCQRLVFKPCGDSIVEERSLFQAKGGGSIPTSPLQLIIEEIKPKLASYLNKCWHSKLPEIHWSNIVRNTHYICYGVKYDGRWYAVGIWSSPVAQNRFKDGKKILELRRLAICQDAPKNTATRILSIMVQSIRKTFTDILRLISYQDTSTHRGIIYKAANWKISTETKFVSWTTGKRKRNKDQAIGTKIRWELVLK